MKSAANSSLAHYLSDLETIVYDDKICQALLEKNTLDLALVSLHDKVEQVTQWQTIFKPSNYNDLQTLIDQVIVRLSQQKQNILNFYIHYFTTTAIIGDKQVSENPDLIVVLGSYQSAIDKRMAYAIDYARQHPQTPLLLSGGGFNLNLTESEYMLGLCQEAKLANPLISESLSMDTIANALFSKILLKKMKRLSSTKRIVIISSKFHLPRALYYFDTIFNSDTEQQNKFHFCAQGALTASPVQQAAVSSHELLSEYNAMQTLSVFNQSSKYPTDDMQMLVELLQNHDLYKPRYDILRELLPYCCE